MRRPLHALGIGVTPDDGSQEYNISVNVSDPEHSAPAGATPFWGFSEALAVSALTGFAYCLQYAFDLGLAARYAIPIQYISVNTSQLIVLAIVLIVGIGFPTAILAHMRSTVIIRLSQLTRVRVLTVVIAYLIACVSLLVAIPGKIPWAIFALGGLLEGGGFVLFYASFTKKDPRKKDSQSQERPRFGLSMARFTKAPTRIILLFYFVNVALAMLPFSFMLGLQVARNQTYFPILQEGDLKNYAIVWGVGDYLLFAERYDSRRRTLTGDVALVKAERDKPLKWKLVHLGVVESEASLERIVP
jgi:hypothetical protein